jgi:hypothetical protein
MRPVAALRPCARLALVAAAALAGCSRADPAPAGSTPTSGAAAHAWFVPVPQELAPMQCGRPE